MLGLMTDFARNGFYRLSTSRWNYNVGATKNLVKFKNRAFFVKTRIRNLHSLHMTRTLYVLLTYINVNNSNTCWNYVSYVENCRRQEKNIELKWPSFILIKTKWLHSTHAVYTFIVSSTSMHALNQFYQFNYFYL